MNNLDAHANTLAVPGARLRYETSGTGPLMVMIPGAIGVVLTT